MSGGSLSYVYCKVENAVSDILSRLHYLEDSERKARYRAFANHLNFVAKALHDVEWVLSSDYGEEGADKAIAAVIDDRHVLAMLLNDAMDITEIICRLNAVIRGEQ